MKDDAVGAVFVDALAGRDPERLESCLHPEVRLRALVPSAFQEDQGVAAVMERLDAWFGQAESIEILRKEVSRVTDRLRVYYRFRERYHDGDSEIIEQNAYCDVRQGMIYAIDLLCSGHLTDRRTEAISLRFYDAGELGCGSGLPQEFRRQIGAVPVGSVLEVVARDPSAKEDLPSLALLLGHSVLSVKTSLDGKTVVTVQRGR